MTDEVQTYQDESNQHHSGEADIPPASLNAIQLRHLKFFEPFAADSRIRT